MVLMGAMAARYAPRGLSCWPPGSKVGAMYTEMQEEANDEWTGRTYDEPRNPGTISRRGARFVAWIRL